MRSICNFKVPVWSIQPGGHIAQLLHLASTYMQTHSLTLQLAVAVAYCIMFLK